MLDLRVCRVPRASGAAFLLFVLTAIGCGPGGGSGDGGPGDGGLASGATCPTGSTLTYESFGQAFFETHCTRCHSVTVAGAARMGAPAGYDFDTVEAIRARAARIDRQAAGGALGVFTLMPPGMPAPTEAERRQLGEWLACGAP